MCHGSFDGLRQLQVLIAHQRSRVCDEAVRGASPTTTTRTRGAAPVIQLLDLEALESDHLANRPLTGHGEEIGELLIVKVGQGRLKKRRPFRKSRGGLVEGPS